MQLGRNQKLTLLIFSLFLLFTDVTSAQDSEVKIFTKSSQTDLSKVRSFFRTADLLISRILPKSKCSSISYSVVLMDKDEFKEATILNQGKKTLRIHLSEDMSTWKNDQQIFSDLIASAILKKSGISAGENYNVIPRWLTYGIVRKIMRRNNRNQIPGTVSCPGVHALVLSGDKVDWLEIISTQMFPEDGGAYKIYQEASEIILDGVLRLPDGKQVILDIIELSNKELKPEDLFRGTITKKIYAMQRNLDNEIFSNNSENDILQEWLNHIFYLSSVNVLNPCNATFAEKLFLESEFIRYYVKSASVEDAQKEERFCKIEELLDKVDEIAKLKSIILKKQRDLVRIAFSMPVPLQYPIYKMEKSLSLLVNGKKDEFLKKYKAEKKIFFDNLEKQHKIENYMFKMEKTFVPPGYRYSSEISILKNIDSVKRKRWPELNKFLNQAE